MREQIKSRRGRELWIPYDKIVSAVGLGLRDVEDFVLRWGVSCRELYTETAVLTR